MLPIAAEIVQTIEDAFADPNKAPSPDEVEALMRPFGAIPFDIGTQVKDLLSEHGRSRQKFRFGAWMEAQQYAFGDPAMKDKIQFFVSVDRCTCVLAHLPKAIELAEADGKRVDQRIRSLFSKK